MKITIADGRGALWQWDTGRRLRVGSGVEQIHYQTDDTGAYTMVQQDFIVHKRAKPAGYVYTPTDQMTLIARLAAAWTWTSAQTARPSSRTSCCRTATR